MNPFSSLAVTPTRAATAPEAREIVARWLIDQARAVN
jgi:hypothetical protein